MLLTFVHGMPPTEAAKIVAGAIWTTFRTQKLPTILNYFCSLEEAMLVLLRASTLSANLTIPKTG